MFSRLALGLVVMLATVACERGTEQHAETEGRYAGDDEPRALLASVDGQAPQDAAVLQRRLDALRVAYDLTLDAHSASKMSLKLHGVRDAKEILARVLKPMRLALWSEARDQGPLTPGEPPTELPGLRADLLREGGPLRYVASDAEPLERWLASLSLPTDTVAKVICLQQDAGQRCAALLLEGPPPVTHADMQQAEVRQDGRSDEVYVWAGLTTEGRNALTRLKGTTQRRRLVVTLDGEPISAHVIEEFEDVGRLRIDFDLGVADDASADLAADLAAALRAGPLHGTWQVERVERRAPTP